MSFNKENLSNIVNENNVNQLDFKDWIMSGDDCKDNLQKWLKFKTGKFPDPDVVLKQAASKCPCIADKLNWYTNNTEIKKYCIDCIFSVATFYKAFLRYYTDNHKLNLKQIYENYDNLFSDNYKNNFCQKQGIERDSLDELLEQLNIFAKNTHTLGNYMNCPDGNYNWIKGNYHKYKDRLELLYKDIQDSSKKVYIWNNWFNDNKMKLELVNILENKELHNFTFNESKMGKEHIKPYTEYINTINNIIEERGKALARKLSENS